MVVCLCGEGAGEEFTFVVVGFSTVFKHGTVNAEATNGGEAAVAAGTEAGVA